MRWTVRVHPGGRRLASQAGRGLSHGRPAVALPDLSHPLRQRGLQHASRSRQQRFPGTAPGAPLLGQQLRGFSPARHPTHGQGPLSQDHETVAPGHHNRGAQVRYPGATGDAVPASADTKGRRRGSLLRPGRELRQGTRVVQEKDAVLVQGTGHHREEPELLRHARGLFFSFSSYLFSTFCTSLWFRCL